ncbi:wall-associated receptor kinase 2-like [Prunus dulcis]|uniref:wall-associated receptor kinase 2-like n=1 Tax=Prunus dulcis TaxID=3755 RepID=UPI0014831BA7|nr:wall-associated receptor kinase 2-like [Prunus dulcis]
MAFQYGMLVRLSIMLLAVLVPAATIVVATTRASARQGGEEGETAMARPGCKPKCGNVTIPYPFGIGAGCYSRPEFSITCIESNNNEPTLPRLMKTRIFVANISLEEGELHILQLVNRDCYDDHGIPLPKEDQSSGGLRVYNPYTISGEKNRFFAVGCDTKAYLFGGRDDQRYTTGCVSICRKKIGGYAIDKNESCSGMGCCETKIPPGLNNLTLRVESYQNHRLRRSRVNLQVKTTTLLHAKEIPPAITGLWVTFAGVGKASKGTHTSMVAKILMSALRTPVRMDSAQIYQEITLVPVIVATATKTRLRASKKQRKSHIEKLKQKYFDANGGALLEKKMATLGKTARFFTENDVQATTNNYDKVKKVGEGRYGIVYKGILDKQEVAIKKSTVSAPIDPNQNTDRVDQKQITAAHNQFVKEMTALYQINHTNVVRLIGCCLDTPTPILVYEFMCKGTLYENIHDKNGKKPSPPLTLAQRLRIAAETADALAYLHHSAVTRFIHRDVKTANILLDKNLTAKLSGFGASTPFPGDENETSILAFEKEKGDDVYSFGLVLVELLTGLKAEEKEVKLFVRSVEGSTLRQTLDEEILEKCSDEVIKKAAELTLKCLNSRGEERLSMKDVLGELQKLLGTMPQHPSGGEEDDISPSPKDTGNLVGSSSAESAEAACK